jgi:hypothetical protein
MADHRTTVTELVTGLGTLGFDDLDAALAARPREMVSLSPEQWDLLDQLHRGGAYRQEFLAAWQNGAAFLAADDGLRGRRPLLVEWRGGQRQPGDEPVPADLRIDHVFLVSCKYLSQIVTNTSPASVFDRLLVGGHGQARSTNDWYAEVAPDAYQLLYQSVVEHCRSDRHGRLEGIGGPGEPGEAAGMGASDWMDAPGGPGGSASGGRIDTIDDLPTSVLDLTVQQRGVLKRRLGGANRRWAPALRSMATEFSTAVAEASALRWRKALDGADPERVLWRLLRVGSAPYFVLGASSHGTLRLRIATAWDWRQHFRIESFAVAGTAREQPVVEWKVDVSHRRSAQRSTIEGHVEIRWSHGKFAQPPEAKVYLDTPHHRIPGYWPLT